MVRLDIKPCHQQWQGHGEAYDLCSFTGFLAVFREDNPIHVLAMDETASLTTPPNARDNVRDKDLEYSTRDFACTTISPTSLLAQGTESLQR